MISYNPPRYLLRRYTILKNINKGKNFLEIGGGNLKFSSELSKKHESGLVVDFEKSVKEVYSNKPEEFKKKVKLTIGDFTKINIKEKFDNVIACEVLEHIDGDLEFLKSINNVLAKNGSVIISVPAKDKYWTIHDDVVGHLRRYEKKPMIELFKKAGFKEIRVYSYGYPFINFLWILRKIHGKKQAVTKNSWSKEKQTKHSGVSQIPKKYDFMGIFINKYSFYPLNLFASMFNARDLSEGYIVIAKKLR